MTYEVEHTGKRFAQHSFGRSYWPGLNVCGAEVLNGLGKSEWRWLKPDKRLCQDPETLSNPFQNCLNVFKTETIVRGVFSEATRLFSVNASDWTWLLIFTISAMPQLLLALLLAWSCSVSWYRPRITAFDQIHNYFFEHLLIENRLFLHIYALGEAEDAHLGQFRLRLRRLAALRPRSPSDRPKWKKQRSIWGPSCHSMPQIRRQITWWETDWLEQKTGLKGGCKCH